MIASGAVLLTVSILLVQTRFDGEWDDAVLLLVVAAGAIAFLLLGMSVRGTGGAPAASQSVLLVAGLGLGLLTLFRVANVLEADTGAAGTLTWMLAGFGALALWPAIRKHSAICTFIAALALGAALVAAWQWLFDPDEFTSFRWLLLALAVVYVVVSLALRGSAFRHSELLVVAAGLAILPIATEGGIVLLGPFGGAQDLPGFWEAIVVVAGCGLIAYAAADKSPGPAYVGTALLVAFVGATTGREETLLWWPVVLGAVGLAALAAGLRPRRPLPPPPDAIPASDLPLAARSTEETVIRVRHEQ